MNFVYFVSYWTQSQGFGNGEITLDKQVTNIGEIRETEEKIAVQLPGGEIPVIISFVLLRTEKAEPAAPNPKNPTQKED